MSYRFVSRVGGILLLALAALFHAAPASAQYFGRNQVQWQRFDFHVLKTQHYEIYYYPEQNAAAEDAARMAERWYARLSKFFDHQFTDRKPIILYDNVPEFQQTTLAGGLVPEGVGGFTEPIRDRLVIPLSGSYADTDHVLGHEMVHVFQFDMATSMTHRQDGGDLDRVPLWMIEGLAEYLSIGRNDPNTTLWLRDAVIRDDLPTYDKLNRDPRYFPYRWGEAFYAYIGGRWGDAAVAEFFKRTLRQSVENAIHQTVSESMEKVFADWQAAIRQEFAESNAAHDVGAGAARPLLAGRPARLNVSPVVSPDGRRAAYLSSRGLFAIELYLADMRTGKTGAPLVSENQDPHFDALRFIDSSGAWSPDSRRFAFVVYSKGENGIAIVDADSHRIVRRISVPRVGEITSLSWSPDAREIVLSGSRLGVTDLWMVDLDDQAVVPLTNDRYADLQPAWSPDGRTIAFSSDRGPQTDFERLTYGPLQLALFDVASRQVRTLSIFPSGHAINPQWSPDGRDLYFIADPDGVSNVYRYSMADGSTYKVTDVLTGVTGITLNSPALSVARATGRVVFSVFTDTRYELYSLAAVDARGVAYAPPPAAATTSGTGAAPGGEPAAANAGLGRMPPAVTTGPDLVDAYLSDPAAGLPRTIAASPEPYRPKLAISMIGPPMVGVASGAFGTSLGGGATAYFSDMLGEHQVGVTVQGQAGNTVYGNTFGAAIQYLNRTHRFNWGASAAHVPLVSIATGVGQTVVSTPNGPVVADVIQQLRQRVTIDQGGLLAAYPLSMSKRFEGSVTYSRYRFQNELRTVVIGPDGVLSDVLQTPSSPTYNLTESSLAFVNDTSYFAFTSPLKGTRYRIEAGSTFGTFRFNTALLDYRKYFFHNPVSFAFRAIHFGRYGGDAENPALSPLFVGRDYLVRGYDTNYDVSQCTSSGAVPAGNSCPVFDRLVGSRMAVMNVELRTQLLGTEDLGIFNSPYLPLELALFFDAGTAWSSTSRPTLKFSRTSDERVPVTSAGLAARVLLGGFVPIEVYYAKPFQLPRQGWTWGVMITPGW